MNRTRFEAVSASLPLSRIAVLGDFCLDRYLEIDPERREISIETGLEVHNVTHVRSQPGAAGTILNNLVDLGISELYPIGFCGLDGEGYELIAALNRMPGVQLEYVHQTPERRTFTYCKPLIVVPGQPPRELNRLDSKNWSPTSATVSQQIISSIEAVAAFVDAIIIMDQVDVAETGVVTRSVLEAVRHLAVIHPQLLWLADSRRGLKNYPPVGLKMNEYELVALTGTPSLSLEAMSAAAAVLARTQARTVFVTLAERGIIGAAPDGTVEHVPAFPVRSEIDIVGAGDAVTANLTAALTAGATMREALEIAMAAASIVIHQLGTTGTADLKQMRALLFPDSGGR
jgi:rfaE bifunctional protein kinase chain/domain